MPTPTKGPRLGGGPAHEPLLLPGRPATVGQAEAATRRADAPAGRRSGRSRSETGGATGTATAEAPAAARIEPAGDDDPLKTTSAVDEAIGTEAVETPDETPA